MHEKKKKKFTKVCETISPAGDGKEQKQSTIDKKKTCQICLAIPSRATVPYSTIVKMGTQFSKIKVTQRVEVHGLSSSNDLSGVDGDGDAGVGGRLPGSSPVLADGDYDVSELPGLFTRRAHHSGVISGHELLSYSFLGGAACQPRRSLRRRHRSKSLYRYAGRSVFFLSFLLLF